MPTITKVLQREMPKVKFIGKRYGEKDRDPQKAFAPKWQEFFAAGHFEKIEKCKGIPGISEDYLGMMRFDENGDFEYWIGSMMAPDAEVPDEFDAMDLPAGKLGVCYLYGQDGPDLFGLPAHEACMNAWAGQGWTVPAHTWFIEGYNCPRYTTPDEKGNVILDYSAYIE